MRIVLPAMVALMAPEPRATAVELFWNDHAGIHRVRPGAPPRSVLFNTSMVPSRLA